MVVGGLGGLVKEEAHAARGNVGPRERAGWEAGWTGVAGVDTSLRGEEGGLWGDHCGQSPAKD